MTATYVQAACPAAMLAKSLLEVWLSGDKRLLRLTVEQLSQMGAVQGGNDESDRIELVKSIAWRMENASDLFTPRRESARTGAWLDLLDHLSAATSSTNCFPTLSAGFVPDFAPDCPALGNASI
jgi:hypothetical protein